MKVGKGIGKLTVRIDQSMVGGPWRWYVVDRNRWVFAQSRKVFNCERAAHKSFTAWVKRLAAAKIVATPAVQLPLFGRLETA